MFARRLFPVRWRQVLGPSSQVRVGIIGLGIGELLADAVQQSPVGVVSAICDIDPGRLDRGAGSHADANVFADGMELISSDQVDAIVVATPDDAHVPYVVRALELGKSVFCEKPLALTTQDLHSVADAVLSAPSSTVLTTNTLLRAAPRYQWLRQTLTDGRLGHIVAAQTGYIYGRFPKITNGWRGRIPGYSVVLGGGIHLIDLLCWTIGEWPVRVTAVGASRGSALHDLAITDTVEAILEFESGIVANLSVVFASAHPHFHEFSLHGTHASFLNLPTGSALLVDSNGVVEDVQSPGGPPHKGVLIPQFLDACLGVGAPAVSIRESLYATAVGIAIDQAARRGETVDVGFASQFPRLGQAYP